MRVWVVRAGEEGELSSVLHRMGESEDALAEGRVFVDRRRVHDARIRVAAGESVNVAPKASSTTTPVDVLLERDGLVAVDKPAGIPTIADHGGASHSLVSLTARALGVSPATLHPTSRLDRGVSGVVVFATTEAARDTLRLAREEGRYERRYVALATRAPEPESGTWSAPIGRAKDPALRRVNGRDAVASETRYATLTQGTLGASAAMLALAPITGRTHQLRVHASHAGAPLLGDKDYGRTANVTLASGEVLRVARIALHCARVCLHFGADRVVVSADVPEELRLLATKLGLDPATWEKAVTCTL